jgi:hypothetical protein
LKWQRKDLMLGLYCKKTTGKIKKIAEVKHDGLNKDGLPIVLVVNIREWCL